MKRRIKDIEQGKYNKKDWRDAFVEAKIISKEQCVNWSNADAVEIKRAGNCTRYALVANYTSQFEGGGFWLSSEGILYLVTNGLESDKEATYEDAKHFIAERT